MEPLSNLFRDLPTSLAAERVDVLVDAPGVRLDRIVSLAHATPPGEWYDQETNEWVILLRGRAALRFEDESAPRVLEPGDHVLIAAHRRHRVEWTEPSAHTVWLALHWPESRLS
jgi:cupin 2 domain-containing protein